MKKYLVIIIIVLGFQTVLSAQKKSEVFTIYLVRHAEKDMSSNNSSDPKLTECGEQRAVNLSSFFSDVNLDVIFSTDYNRTKSTARPTATAKGQDINIYEVQELEKLSSFLINCGKDALVVGHSNTTGVLAGFLIGEEIGSFDLGIYNRIYKVVFQENNGQLHLLHTAFECFD